MKYKTKDGREAPQFAIKIAVLAAKKYGVPVGILLGTVERESDFRLGLVSSAGAVGPCQFKPEFAEDYLRYGGYRFDLEGWESIRGLGACYGY